MNTGVYVQVNLTLMVISNDIVLIVINLYLVCDTCRFYTHGMTDLVMIYG